MSRVIKFRGWSESYKKYLEDMQYPNGHSMLWLFASDGTPYHIEVGFDGLESTPLHLKIGEVVLEQFTGLTDKNGTEIYEGDMDATGIVIKWDEIAASFICMREGNFVDYLGEISNLLIIIGNIHENPDLIK